MEGRRGREANRTKSQSRHGHVHKCTHLCPSFRMCLSLIAVLSSCHHVSLPSSVSSRTSLQARAISSTCFGPCPLCTPPAAPTKERFGDYFGRSTRNPEFRVFWEDFGREPETSMFRRKHYQERWSLRLHLSQHGHTHHGQTQHALTNRSFLP